MVGASPDTLRTWYRQLETDAGRLPGVTLEEKGRIKELEREVRQLRRANQILLAACSFCSGARPETSLVVAFMG